MVGGERWKEALRRNVRQCEAVIFVVTPAWRASEWCLAEYQLAESFHKPVFGVVAKKFDIANLPGNMADDWQVVDLTRSGQKEKFSVTAITDGTVHKVSFNIAELTRLKTGLENTGINPKYFEWPPQNEPDRSPYQGLKALQQEDAGIFFGRDGQVVETLDRLRGLHDGPPPRMLVILGASGAGKSSFMRAGLLPKLKRDDRHFLVLDPLRPGRQALSGPAGLVQCIKTQMTRAGLSTSTNDIRQAVGEAVALGGEEGQALASIKGLLENLIQASRPEGSTQTKSIILPIDQAEELYFTNGDNGDQEAEQLRSLLAQLTTSEDLRLIVLLTIRSDTYEHIQFDQILGAVDHQTMSLPPIPQGSYSEIILGPVRRMQGGERQLKVEDRLVDRLLQDIAEGGAKDALPLLAFTLQRLYAEYSKDDALRLSDYEAMGQIRGSIEAAVEEAFVTAEAMNNGNIPANRDAGLSLLRRGLIPWLATVDPDTYETRRRVAAYSTIPEEARPLIDLLVEQRLLSKDTRAVVDRDGKPTGETEITIEPAHESLLRQWGQLEEWLDEDRDALSALDAVKRSSVEWDANGRDKQWLAHTAGRLETALSVSRDTRFHGYLTATDTQYLDTCADEDRKRRDAELEAQKKITQRTRIGAIAASILMCIAGLLGWYGFQQAEIAENKNKQNQEFITNTHLRNLNEQIFQRKWEASLETINQLDEGLKERTGEGASYEKALYRRNHLLALYHAYNQSQFSERIASDDLLSSDGLLRLSPDNKSFLVSKKTIDNSDDNQPYNLEVWDIATKARKLVLSGHTDEITHAAFNDDGSLIVTGSNDQTIRVWDANTGDRVALLLGHSDIVRFAEFLFDGKSIISYAADGTIRVWGIENQQLNYIHEIESDYYFNLEFHKKMEVIVVYRSHPQEGKYLDVLNAKNLALQKTIMLAGDVFNTEMKFNTAGSLLAVEQAEGNISIFETNTWMEVKALSVAKGTVDTVAFSDKGKIFIAGSATEIAAWRTENWSKVSSGFHERGHVDAIKPIGESKMMINFGNEPLELWDISIGTKIYDLEDHKLIGDFDIVGEDGLISITRDGEVRIWANLNLINTTQRLEASGKKFILFKGKSSSSNSKELFSLVDGDDSTKTAVFALYDDDIYELSSRGSFRIWDGKTGKLIKSLENNIEDAKIITTNTKKSMALLLTDDKRIGLWDIDHEKLINTWNFEGDWLNVAFSETANLFALQGFDEKIEIRSSKDGSVVSELTTDARILFSHDGRHAISGGQDGIVTKWEISTGNQIMSWESSGSPIDRIEYDENDSFILIGQQNGKVSLLDSSNLNIVAERFVSDFGVGEMFFNQKNEQVVISSNSTFLFWPVTGKVQVLSKNLQKIIATLPIDGFVADMDLSENGDFLATTSEIGEISIWDLVSKRQYAVIPSGSDPIATIQFSHDGKRLLAVSPGKSAKVWNISDFLVRPLGNAVSSNFIKPN